MLNVSPTEKKNYNELTENLAWVKKADTSPVHTRVKKVDIGSVFSSSIYIPIHMQLLNIMSSLAICSYFWFLYEMSTCFAFMLP